MSEKRTKGKGLARANTRLADKIYVHKLESMGAAIDTYIASWKEAPGRDSSVREYALKTMPGLMLDGDPETMPGILAHADSLAEAAVLIDERLGGRSSWVRGVEGVELDPGLLMAGEEACMFRRQKRQTETGGNGQPVRIVISTDTKNISHDAASAFIAAAKLAGQFVPLEIWWQGSWLNEDRKREDYGNGQVFLVPLVRAGGMDYSRLQFVLSSKVRDHVSNRVALMHAMQDEVTMSGGVLEYSKLEGTKDFIPASGLRASAESVADRAARWIGMESRYMAEYDARQSNLQSWTPDPDGEDAGSGYQDTTTPAQRRKEQADYQRRERERQKEARQAARERSSKGGL